MQIGLRQVQNDAVEWFKQAALSNEYSRYGLAKQLCERIDWYNDRGEPSITQAYQALPKLADGLGIQLPALRGSRPAPSELARYGEALRLEVELEQLGKVSVELVASGEHKLWCSMMHDYHPVGEPQLPGKSLKYWLVSEHYGRLGGLSYHAASWHEAARDRFIGWSARARVVHLGEVVNNSRFLILPEVKVYGLASVALRCATARLCDDWYQAYAQPPQLAYTYVDQRHSGYSYHCAGWHHIGKTSGRRGAEGGTKHVYALPLVPKWQVRLCSESKRRFHPFQERYVGEAAHWTQIEYGLSTHPDGRVRRRLLSMGQAWARKPGKQTPEMFANEASRKGAYRLLSNDNVSMDDILESHRQASVERSKRHGGVVLAVQDTTALNYDTMKGFTTGLTKIGGTAKGIYAHAQVVFSPAGRVLGVLDIDGNFRARCAGGGKELKESIRWIEGLETAAEFGLACGSDTRVVSVSDREADVWELFARQHELDAQVGCLVRANGARQRTVLTDAGQSVKLRAHVESQPAVARRAVDIAAQGGKRQRKARTAKVTLRIAKVQLKAPGQSRETLPMMAVSVLEEQPPAGIKAPLNWLLLCSEGEADGDNALRICQWYETRWGIEEYFRTLKTGCQIEERQFDDADDLLKCMAFDAITAWRVLDLQRLAKYEPDRLASEIIDEDEIKIQRVLLSQIHHRYDIRPPPDLTIRQYVVDVGRLAGFNPTKKQPIPGTKKLWQGEKDLKYAVRTYEAMNQRGLVNKNAWSSMSN